MNELTIVRDMKSGRFILRPIAASLPVSHWFSTYTTYCLVRDDRSTVP